MKRLILAVLLCSPLYAQTLNGLGYSTTTCVDVDGDGYGSGVGCIGPDADDMDRAVHTGLQAISKWGTLSNFLAHLGYTPSRIWYIATTGNDSTCVSAGAPVGISSPCLTFTPPRANLLAGDMVMYRAGSYTASAARFNPSIDGTSGNPIIAIAYPGESVLIDATSYGSPGADIGDRSWITIDGIKFTGSGSACISGGTSSSGLSVNTFQNNTLTHLEVYACGFWGFIAAGLDNTTVQDSVFHDMSVSNGQHGVYIGARDNVLSSNNVIKQVISYNNPYTGIQVNGNVAGLVEDQNIAYGNLIADYSWENGVHDSFFRSNLAMSWGGSGGLVISEYNGNEGLNDCGMSGTSLCVCTPTPNFGATCAHNQTGNLIENFTAYGTSQSQAGTNVAGSPPINVALQNRSTACTTPTCQNADLGHNTFRNIIAVTYGINNHYPPIIFNDADKTYLSTSTFNNVMVKQSDSGNGSSAIGFGVDTGSFGFIPYTCAASTAITTISSCTNADPQFVSASPSYFNSISSFNFNLSLASPAIHAGTATGIPDYDLVGNTFASTPSLGAYEITIPIQVTGTTPTQAVVSYKPGISGTCSSVLTDSSGNVANDVNPSLFTNADLDNRTGDLVVGNSRQVVFGRRTVETALDGKQYSRALQANETYRLTLTCGSSTGVATFKTQNPPLGNNASDVQPASSSGWGNYSVPTVDFSNQDSKYVDPLTGVLVKNATNWQLSNNTNGQTFAAAFDPTNSWTTPANIIGTSGTATCPNSTCGGSSAYLYLQSALAFQSNSYSTQANILDMRLHMSGVATNTSGDNAKVSACITVDHGQTCSSNTVDLPAFPSGSPAVENYPSSNYPSPMFIQWVTLGAQPPLNFPSTPLIQKRTGAFSVNGTTATWVSGNTWEDMVAGDIIVLPGSGCPTVNSVSDSCTVAAVVNAKTLTIGTSVSGPVTGSFTASNFGFKIWKKTATGSISLNTAQFDWANDNPFIMPVGGSIEGCSSVVANTTIDRNGNPLGYTQPGYLCTQEDSFNNARLFWHGTNGEVRYISQLVRKAVASPALDSISYNESICAIAAGNDPLGNFDVSDPNTVYCAGNKTDSNTYDVMYKCTYDSSDVTWGNYKEWSSNFVFSNTDNPAMTCTNVTKASLGNDLDTQIHALASGFTSMRYVTGPGTLRGSSFSLVSKVVPGQDTLGYYSRYDTGSSTVTLAHDTWSVAPMRWGSIHGFPSTYTSGPNSYLTILITWLRDATANGRGQFQIIPLTIAGNVGTGLDNSYVDSRTCEALGVGPPYTSEGATGNHCIDVTVDRSPYNPTPNTGDLNYIPDPTNSVMCHGDGSTSNCYSYLQDAIEGDYLYDSGIVYQGDEQFRIVKKFSNTHMILQRGASTASCTTQQMSVHAANWVAIMIPNQNCGSNVYFVDSSGNVTADDEDLANGHQDILTNASTTSSGDTGTLAEAGGYFIRGCTTCTISSQIGQPATYNSPGSYIPLFANSTSAVSTSVIQSHPSSRQHQAPPSEYRWTIDGRPFGLSEGGSNRLGCNTVTTTTQTQVYKVTYLRDCDNSTQLSYLDRKNLPLQVWAGRYLLQDKSGPGSTLLTADAWKYCVADFAGECFATSSAGDVFMNVPQVDTTGTVNLQMEDNIPVWVSAAAATPYTNQVQIDRPDPFGNYWRRVSNYFNGMGYTNNFWNARSLPDASWAYTNSAWVNGIANSVTIAKLPQWSTSDTVPRNGFVPVNIQINAPSSGNYTVLFGYNTNLYCTSRLEQCATGGNPFKWISEGSLGQTCSGPCTISIPAISGRVLYYEVEAPSGNWPIQAITVN